jgi:hypothetical protein
MPRHLAALPPVWGAIAAGAITHDTAISLALFIGGIAVSAGLVWWARGKTDRWDADIKQIKADVKQAKNEIHGLRITVYGRQEDKQ